MRLVGSMVVVLALAASAPVAVAAGPVLPSNDLQGALTLTGGQTPARMPTQRDPEPPLRPVPRADCGPGSHPLAGQQGRVPREAVDSPEAARGWTCNVEVVGHHATPGGFRVWRYVDRAGHACAFYDTSASSAANVVSLAAGPTQGVVVLDMADASHPVETARLTAPGTLSPHESLNLNVRRGLLAAEVGTAGTAPGILSIYDVGRDCRRPEHLSDFVAAPFGHESGFSPDGRTFWVGGGEGIAAVDVADPRAPRTLWTGNVFAHGLNLSDDGRTLFDADPIDGDLIVLDVGEIQDRRPGPQVREISRLTWSTVSIPQNTVPLTIASKPYLLEFDEFAFRFNPATVEDRAGAARIIDIADLAHPRVVSDLRLEVNMPDAHRAAAGDPSFVPGSSTAYGAHYCAVPRQVDPGIVACSFLNSGLRVFDVRDPKAPREVAYFVSPPGEANGQRADAAFAQPAFDVARREVWFSDASTGLWAVRLSRSAWPDAATPARAAARRCASRRAFTVRVRPPRRGRIASARVSVGGHRLPVRRRGGRFVSVVRLTGRPRRKVRVRIVVRTTDGRRYSDSRTYHPCRARTGKP